MLSSFGSFREAIPGLTETVTPEQQTQLTLTIRPLMKTLSRGLETMMPLQQNSRQKYIVGDARSIYHIDNRGEMLLGVIPDFEKILQISLPDDQNTCAQLTMRQEPRLVGPDYIRSPKDEIVSVAGQAVLVTPSILLWLCCPDDSGRHLLEAKLTTETDAQWLTEKTIDGIIGDQEKHPTEYALTTKELVALKKPWDLLFDTLAGIAVSAS